MRKYARISSLRSLCPARHWHDSVHSLSLGRLLCDVAASSRSTATAPQSPACAWTPPRPLLRTRIPHTTSPDSLSGPEPDAPRFEHNIPEHIAQHIAAHLCPPPGLKTATFATSLASQTVHACAHVRCRDAGVRACTHACSQTPRSFATKPGHLLFNNIAPPSLLTSSILHISRQRSRD